MCLLPQALIFPKQLYEAIFEEELTTIKIFVRLYGATLLSKLGEEKKMTLCRSSIGYIESECCTIETC